MPQSRAGVVSVVLVNFRGADDTIEALEALAAVDWPTELLELIVVENGSGDDSAERLRAAAPNVSVIVSGENLGFAGGCNLGVASSSGEYVAFLNSDAKPDPQWIRTAVDTFERDDSIGAVASKVLDWRGDLVDYIESGLTWFGKGYKPYVGELVGNLGQREKDVLFGTGSAMFVRADVFEQLGGFDESYFMFYEDVDFGWRLNLLGWRFRYQPLSVAFHKHHGAVSKFPSANETYFLERNALFTLYKNVEQRNLDAALPAALALTIHRAVSEAGLESTEFDYRNGAIGPEAEKSIPHQALASIYAVDQFVERLTQLTQSRRRVQASRKVSDRAIWSLFGRVDVVDVSATDYVRGYDNLVEAFPVTEPVPSTKVLIITGDPIGAKMAGPAIRAWHIAEALALRHNVTLVTLSTLEELAAPFELGQLRAGDNRAFERLERWADVIVFQGHAMAAFDALQDTSKIVVADIYDPMHLEQLEQGRELPAATWAKQVADATKVLNEQLLRADFFLCASERQRMFYLGQLAALGRINPANYSSDPDLSKLIAVVPFGFDSVPPIHERQVLKGVREGIGREDKLLLWSGGLYNWFDPETLILAVAQLSKKHDNIRLFFQGTKHPHPGVPEMAVVRESRQLAARLGVLDRSVFFNESWVDYADRQNYLIEADAGVSTHFSHIETTFSFRTRILDYLWAGLPMVVTEGDSFAELVAAEGLGLVVPQKDVDALASALESTLFDEEFITRTRSNVARVRERFRWERTLEALVEFIDDPHHAADVAEDRLSRVTSPVDEVKRRRRRRAQGLRRDVSLVLHHLRNGGPRVVFLKVLNRIRSR
jgi:GT2 family glycosyltransferase/glycosyltransferase involved in cell wall biosynthesis